jgi:hypothetical protein
MTRERQLRVIRRCLKELGVKGIRMLDCSKLQGVNENYRNNFWGVNIDTFFLCVEHELDTDDEVKKAFGVDRDCYCVEYGDYFVYFNASAFMRHAIESERPATPQSRIMNIVKIG